MSDNKSRSKHVSENADLLRDQGMISKPTATIPGRTNNLAHIFDNTHTSWYKDRILHRTHPQELSHHYTHTSQLRLTLIHPCIKYRYRQSHFFHLLSRFCTLVQYKKHKLTHPPPSTNLRCSRCIDCPELLSRCHKKSILHPNIFGML
jgi:hypothetical protein